MGLLYHSQPNIMKPEHQIPNFTTAIAPTPFILKNNSLTISLKIILASVSRGPKVPLFHKVSLPKLCIHSLFPPPHLHHRVLQHFTALGMLSGKLVRSL
jgi:hypothetical protein